MPGTDSSSSHPRPRSPAPSGDKKGSSYYSSPVSNQRVARPGAPMSKRDLQLQLYPTKDWVRRNAPTAHFDLPTAKFFTGTEVIQQIGKEDGLTGIRTMSVVGDKVWIGEREGCFSIWDFQTGKPLYRSTIKRDIFVWCILALDANRVAIGFSDSYVRIFDTNTYELVKEKKEHLGGVYCLTQSPSGKMVFSGSSDFTIIKWDGVSFERTGHFNGHRNSVRSLLVVGRYLYSGGDDHTIKIWDIVTSQLVQSWDSHTGGVHGLEFACGKHIWSASEDKTIRVWDPSKTEEEGGPCIHVLDYPHTGQINCLILVGSQMWSTSWNHIFVWDPQTMELKGQYKEHDGCINALVPVHQSVVSRVWSASNDGLINCWNSECMFSTAMNAASDGRLEEALAQLEDSNNLVTDLTTSKKDLERDCKLLKEERDVLENAYRTHKETSEQQHQHLLDRFNDATANMMKYKEKLARCGGDGNNYEETVDDQDLLSAFYLGRHANQPLPVEWQDDPRLSARDRERRQMLREAFNKGRESVPKTGEEGVSRHRVDIDPTEAKLKAALEKAYRLHDATAAKVLQQYLDDNFPGWREKAATPVLPITYLDEPGLPADQKASRRALREAFVNGILELPAVKAKKADREQKDRPRRDAYLRGGDMRGILPAEYRKPEAAKHRAAFVRGLGTSEGPAPEEYTAGSLKEPSQAELLHAFVRGRIAARRIPEAFQDSRSLAPEEREKRLQHRIAFLCGLTHSMPDEIKEDMSLQHTQRKQRAMLREVFMKGEDEPSWFPEECESEDLRTAFSYGYALCNLPSKDRAPPVHRRLGSMPSARVG
eukprot:Sspe_Gene.4737::Locus_1558_Transcript_1_1_Confidence_1.000_Length_8260::g.4737::m.4737